VSALGAGRGGGARLAAAMKLDGTGALRPAALGRGAGAAAGALPLPLPKQGGESEKASQAASFPEGREELPSPSTNGGAPGFRLDAGAGVARGGERSPEPRSG
jgi:hypothetical protein